MGALKLPTIGSILALLFPPVTPKKKLDGFDRAAYGTLLGIAAWGIVGHPDFTKLNLELPKFTFSVPPYGESAKNATSPATNTAPSATPIVSQSTPRQGVLVLCPQPIRVVNIRQSAGLTRVLGTVPCGQRLNVTAGQRWLANGEVWVPVAYGGTRGWVARRFLQL
ncbi:MAG: hypothetical protein B0A82_21785 [Alkalinema sp. CACIAM 70d]|nr:MAG: hypothetical protein B0A82_21785 [Alkalinema sp. CACIAM 70d]